MFYAGLDFLFSDEFSTEVMDLQFSQYQHQSSPVPSTDKVCSAFRYRNIIYNPLGRRHEYTRGFHMRCQRQILDVCWWAHVSNAEVLQRSGLSTIGDILRHRRLSLFGQVFGRLDPGVPAHALRLMVDGSKAESQWPSWRRPPGRPRNVWLNKIQGDANAHCYLCCGDLRSPWVTERRNGSLRVRDDDDGDDDEE